MKRRPFAISAIQRRHPTATTTATITTTCPILLAGRAGGTWTPGKRMILPSETPMTNLYLSMLDRFGVNAERVGDSTGVLEVG